MHPTRAYNLSIYSSILYIKESTQAAKPRLLQASLLVIFGNYERSFIEKVVLF